MNKMALAAIVFLLATANAISATPMAATPMVGLDQKTLAAMLDNQGGAIFEALDKVTARVTMIYAPVDVPVHYGTLSLTVRKCKARPPEEQPEKAVFVEIDEAKAKNPEPNRLFTGWMFWSSPALNALQHPVYDVWLSDCRMSAGEREAQSLNAAPQDATTVTLPGVGEDAAAPPDNAADDSALPPPSGGTAVEVPQ